MTKTRNLSKEGPVESKVASPRELYNRLEWALGYDHQVVASLVPILMKAVEDYPNVESAMESERAKGLDQLYRQVLAAEAIRRKAESLLRVIEKSRRPIRDGLSAGHLPRSYESLPATAQGSGNTRSLADLLGYWSAADAAIGAVRQLAAEAKQWESVARTQARRRPGRTTGTRSHLASWVGLKLAKKGIPLVTTKSGRWARVVTVINEEISCRAAGKRPVNPYQARDLRSELKYLREEFPHLVADPRVQNPHPKKVPNV